VILAKNLLIRLLGFNALVFQGDVLFVERVRWLQKRLRPDQCRTLDAGCGAGGLSILAAKSGHDTLGLTFSKGDAEIASRRAALLGAHMASFEVVDLRDLGSHVERLGHFDQIIACEVIEHILDDDKLFANLAKLLAHGGQLFLTTPFEGHIPVHGEVVQKIENGGHVRFGYTHRRLKELCEANSLTVLEIGYLNGFFAQKTFSTYVRLCRLHPKLAWFLTIPLRPLRHLDPIVRRISRYPDMSVTLVCSKR
jgi:2-polyprenyl-3-methyl-5-hydroxy-6-metoxy-1,4-benzoquinol methylase